MSEQNVADIGELAVLRQTNAELTQKNKERKDRILTLVKKQDELTAKLTAAEAGLYEATVGAPLKKMAEAVSPVPELWQSEFLKHYKVEMKDGKLAVLTQKGEQAMVKDKPVEFTRAGLTDLLIKSDAPEFRAFKTIMAVSSASGGGAGSLTASGKGNGQASNASIPASKPAVQFGLR